MTIFSLSIQSLLELEFIAFRTKYGTMGPGVAEGSLPEHQTAHEVP